MIRHESKFGLLFRRWWLANRGDLPAAGYELKDTRGASSLPFSAVEPHQRQFADAMRHAGGALIRVMAGTPGAPDYVGGRMPTYYAIRYPGFFCLVDSDDFYSEMFSGDRKSLTAARAREIAWKVVELADRPARRASSAT